MKTTFSIIKYTFFLFLFSQSLIAQDQVHNFTAIGDRYLNSSASLNNESYIFGSAAYFNSENENDPGVLNLQVFNTSNKTLKPYEFQTSVPLEISGSTLVDALNAQNGDALLVFNNFFDSNQQFPKGSFAYMRIDAITGEEKIKVHKSDSANSILIQEVLLLSEDDASHFIIFGSERYDYSFGRRFYFAEFKNDSLIYEGFSQEKLSVAYYSDDFFRVKDTYYIASYGGEKGKTHFFISDRDSLGNFNFKRSEPFALPYIDNSSADREQDGFNYANTFLTNVIQLNDSLLVSCSNYSTLNFNISASFYDTISLGIYFFTPQIDSIKYVDLSRQYGYTKASYPYIARTKDNNFCVTGAINSEVYFNRIADAPYAKGLTAMVNDTGKVLWNYEISEDLAEIRLVTVVATSTGGCIFAGDRIKNGETDGRDMIVVELDSLGTLTSISDESLAHLFDRQKIAAYPNPAQSQGQVNLSWSGMQKQNWQVKFYDKQGRMVYETSLQQGLSESILQLPELPSGTYILRAEGSGKQVHTGTVVVE